MKSHKSISTKLFSEKLISKGNEITPNLIVEADYKIAGKYGERKGVITCGCFVKQFGQLLHMMFGGLHAYSIKDTAGSIQTPDADLSDSHTLQCSAGAADGTYGIQVGLDNTAVDINDYVLASLCAQGSGLNEFNYGGPVSFNIGSDATSNTVIATRTFANNSGDSIVVKEIGLVVSNDSGKFLILRDIIADAGLTVLTTEELTVNYKIKAVA